ncbi:MAG: hypothetical protein VCA55_03955 [Verrucomicrobiales bacterium]|jgi:hypothetical protein
MNMKQFVNKRFQATLDSAPERGRSARRDTVSVGVIGIGTGIILIGIGQPVTVGVIAWGASPMFTVMAALSLHSPSLA